MREALLDAGLVRLRPVLVTVGATVLGLVPLALHGGPLWEPLCYAQIGGLTVATALTLLLVPVLYSIVVRDLHWIKWPEAPPARSVFTFAPTGSVHDEDSTSVDSPAPAPGAPQPTLTSAETQLLPRHRKP
jgi:hypothetical protein